MKMKPNLWIFGLSAFISIFSSCLKQPQACFDKLPGSSDTLNNKEQYYFDATCATHATEWVWRVDGRELDSTQYPYMRHTFQTSGNHRVSLTVTNQNKKANTLEKIYYVKP